MKKLTKKRKTNSNVTLFVEYGKNGHCQHRRC